MPPEKRTAETADLDSSKLSVAQLKEELKKRGCTCTGNKAQLVSRLEDALNGKTERSRPLRISIPRLMVVQFPCIWLQASNLHGVKGTFTVLVTISMKSYSTSRCSCSLEYQEIQAVSRQWSGW